jgi:HD-GYP domain-containing protein (c-di-GMP phosphodiesterase class II)
MHKHPEIGYHIIGHIGYFAAAAEIIRTHHEHFDGSGYPRGLKCEEIPHGARVFAVADALDALTVTRPYRLAVSFDASVEEILRASGTTFDPAVVEAFLKASEELKELVGRIVFDSNIGHGDLLIP